MRRRMIYDIRFICVHNPVDSAIVAHRTNQYDDFQIFMSSLKLLLYLIRIILVNIKYNQTLRARLGNLTAELASDGTAAPRNQYHLIPDGRQNLLVIYFHLRSSQQVCDLYVTNPGYIHFTVNQLRNTGNRLQFTVRLLADIQDLLTVLSGRSRNRVNDMINLIFFYHRQNIVSISYDRNAF